jgi:hypothetical protein
MADPLKPSVIEELDRELAEKSRQLSELDVMRTIRKNACN